MAKNQEKIKLEKEINHLDVVSSIACLQAEEAIFQAQGGLAEKERVEDVGHGETNHRFDYPAPLS